MIGIYLPIAGIGDRALRDYLVQNWVEANLEIPFESYMAETIYKRPDTCEVDFELITHINGICIQDLVKEHLKEK